MVDKHSNVRVNRQYKDSLFCMLFGQNKENALSLYNAVNHTNYDNPDELEFTTLKDVIYMKMKNDVSFIIDKSLSLYEHQSTFNPNMPLRGLLYFSALYQKELDDRRLYGRRLVRIPNPQYIVFYNGSKKEEERILLKLSDAFEKPDPSGMFEWTAIMLNINYGQNKELLEKCIALQHYAIFISKVRQYNKSMDLEDAVTEAVQECIRENVLREFLEKHRKELSGMILEEFDEEGYYELLREEGYEDGYEAGQRDGHEAGLAKGLEEGKIETIRNTFFRALDKGILPELAMEIVGYTKEEAETALQKYRQQ